MRNSVFMIVVIFLLAGSGGLYAQDATMGLKQYIELLNQHDPELKKLTVRKQQLVYFVDKETQENAFQLSVLAEKGYGSDDIDTSTLQGALSKEFIHSGTRFTVNHRKLENTDRNENFSEFRVEQDVLKNAFGNTYKAQQQIIEQEFSVSELEAQEQYEDYLVNKLLGFLDVVYLQKEKDLLNASLKQAQSLQRFVEQKLAKGAAYQSDVMQVQLQLLQRQQQLMQVEQLLAEQKTALLASLALPASILLIDTEFSVNNHDADFSKEQLGSLREYKIYEHYRSIGLHRYQLSKQANKADIKLFAALSQDDSSRYSSTVDRHESSFGVSLSKALGSKKLDAGQAYQKLQADIDELELEVNLTQAEVQLAYLQQSIQQKQSEIKLVDEKATLAKAIFADEQKRYERGRMDIDQLMQSFDRLYNYQMELDKLKTEYRQQYLLYLEFTDQLVGFISR